MINGAVDKNYIKVDGHRLDLQLRTKKKSEAKRAAKDLGLTSVRIIKRAKPKRFLVYGT